MNDTKKRILNKLKEVPLGAHIAVFGSNPFTKLWGSLETHMKKKNVPTHSAIYVGKGKHTILEATKWLEFNTIEKYLKKKKVKVVAQWYKDITQEEGQELKTRIYFFTGKKLFYDVFGYAGFVFRLFPFLTKLLPQSKKLFFCSELVATIYEGDSESRWKEIRSWDVIESVSVKSVPSSVAPVDIYSYMKKQKDCKTLVIKDRGEKI